MLQAIWEGIQGIWEAIISVIEFIIDFVKDLVELIEIVAESFSRIEDYLSFLPAEIVLFLLVIFGVVVLYKVLGREG